MNAIEFAYDYIYHHVEYKERHPNLKKYRFGKLKGKHKGTISELYRGLYFETKEGYEAFLTQIQNNVWKISDISSWTVDKEVAFHFLVVPYVQKKQTGYCGVVVKIKNVPNTDILFDTLIAHWHFQRLGKTFPNDKPYIDEGEIVLKPMMIEVAQVVPYIFSEIEAFRKEKEDTIKMERKNKNG